MNSGKLPTPRRPITRTAKAGATTHASNLGPTEEDHDEDWEACDPDPTNDEFLDLGELDDEDEALPDHGDFWQDPDELEDEWGV
jgi:hypothetical protein